MSSEWIKLLSLAPEDCLSSATVIKKITIVIISTISYLKDALPKDSYTVETFQDFKLRVLKNNCTHGLAKFLSSALADAFDALDKKYLHKLALYFYESDCEVGNMIESHVFEYSYHSEGVSMNFYSKNKDTIQKHSFDQQTVDLIKAIFLVMRPCQNKLPTEYGVRLRVYYNKDTPDDYVAPGFTPEEEIDNLEHNQTKGLVLGNVDTDFHSLRILSYVRTHRTTVETGQATREELPNFSSLLIDTKGLDGSTTCRRRLSCPCRMNDDVSRYQDEELLTCFYCNTQQHAACFGVFGAATSLSRHCCVDCLVADTTRQPTDLRIIRLPSGRRVSLCVFRRVLKLCSQRDFVDVRILVEQFCMSDKNATKVMKLLNTLGVVQQKPNIDENRSIPVEQCTAILKKWRWVVPIVRHLIIDNTILNSNNLKNISEENLKKAFKNFSLLRKENITDRLIEEIEVAVSQESFSCLTMENVLTSTDKEELSNTSSFGRVIKKPDTKSNENTLLRQYREVFISEECIDPLLSPDESNSAKRKMEQTVSSDAGFKKRKLQLKKNIKQLSCSNGFSDHSNNNF